MRSLIVLALSAAALAVGGQSASADPTCTPWVGHWLIANARACGEYVCVEICAPEYVVTVECQPGTHPPRVVEQVCVAANVEYRI